LAPAIEKVAVLTKLFAMTPRPNPAIHPIEAMIGRAVESMSSFQNADAAFAADAPPLPATKPSLALKGPSRRRFRSAPGQDEASNVENDRRLFVARGA
jgi:hypothetical protein